MRVVFVNQKNKGFSPESAYLGEKSLILLSPCSHILSLDDELRGESNIIRSLCRLSLESDLTVLSPTVLLSRGKKFFGTLVIDRGRFLGISDCTHPFDSALTKSNSLRVFETSLGRLGIVSGDDICFFEVSRLMSLWECDLLVFALGKRVDKKSKILAEAQGYSNGVSAVLFGEDALFAYNCATIKRESKYTALIEPKKDGALLDSRRRELYRELILR